MLHEHLKIGDTIETEAGYEVIKDFNGHIVYTDSYVIGEDGNATKESAEMFTPAEIAGLLRAIDGRNHKVIIDK